MLPVISLVFVTVLMSQPGAEACGRVRSANQRMVDLSSETILTNKSSRGVPGSEYGGTPSHPIGPTLFELPLRITVVQKNPEELIIDVCNLASSEFRLPVAVNGRTVHMNGKKNRRTLRFGVDIPREGGSPRYEVVFQTFSSDSEPRSYITLAPGAAVRVKLPKFEQCGVKGRIFIEGETMHDDRYVVSARSSKVETTTVIGLPCSGTNQ